MKIGPILFPSSPRCIFKEYYFLQPATGMGDFDPTASLRMSADLEDAAAEAALAFGAGGPAGPRAYHNVSALIGKTAFLTCVVKNLGKSKSVSR